MGLTIVAREIDNFKDIDRQRIRVSVASGETTDPIPVRGAPGRVAVSPGAGGTMKVQMTGSPLSVVEANPANAIWEDWDAGTVSVVTSEAYHYTTAVRFIATTAAGIGEIAS